MGWRGANVAPVSSSKSHTKVFNTSLSPSLLPCCLPLSLALSLSLSSPSLYYCFYCVVSLGALPGRAGGACIGAVQSVYLHGLLATVNEGSSPGRWRKAPQLLRFTLCQLVTSNEPPCKKPPTPPHLPNPAYSMEPCARIPACVCVWERPGRVELQVGLLLLFPLLSPFLPPLPLNQGELLFLCRSAPWWVPYMHVRELGGGGWYVKPVKHHCFFWFERRHGCSLRAKQNVQSARFPHKHSETSSGVFACRITNLTCLPLLGEWGLTCQLIASAEISSCIITPPSIHLPTPQPPQPQTRAVQSPPHSPSSPPLRLAPGAACWAASATHHCASMQVQTGGVWRIPEVDSPSYSSYPQRHHLKIN